MTTVVEPGFFPGDEGPLYGVLHRSAEVSGRGRAALLCPPASFEYTATHRALRVMADRLAAAGIPVLRFDWSGTGDSLDRGTDGRPQLAHWRNDVLSALEWLLATTGAQTVVPVGVRLGGSVAVMELRADSRMPAMVLWSPIVRAEEQTRHVEEEVAAVEERFSGRDRGLTPALALPGGLNQVDLLCTTGPFPEEVLIVDDHTPSIQLLADRMRAAGARVHERITGDFDVWRHHEVVEQVVPPETLRVIVEWVREL